MLKLDTLRCLMKRTCPFCETDLEFDNRHLHCTHCKIGWDYNDYKRSKELYEYDPEDYINHLIYDNYPKHSKNP